MDEAVSSCAYSAAIKATQLIPKSCRVIADAALVPGQSGDSKLRIETVALMPFLRLLTSRSALCV